MTTLEALSRQLGALLTERQLRCVVAESCTGGQLAAAITLVEGCSQWFERGYVSYSNASKSEMLGVDEDIINTYGAVSRETACAMAQGALLYSPADVSVAVTGIAGPGGGSAEKPVGTVWIAWAVKQAELITAISYLLHGSRQSIQQQVVALALQGWFAQILGCQRT